MKTSVREERLLVVSDIHMGNTLHQTRRQFREFVQFALDHSYSICINGDGIDIAQLSLRHLMSELIPSLGLFLRFNNTDRSIYYTVGNHDIALEHFLSDIGRMKVLPFLNVYSGSRRIRVEHGHMYDTMFLRYPRTYTTFMTIGRMAIGVSPVAYEALHHVNVAFIDSVEWIFDKTGIIKKKPRPEGAIDGEREYFRQGAENIGMRGFDAVVFGHTHYHGSSVLQDGMQYYNTGAWFKAPHCVAIDRGRLWFGPVSELVGRDPFPIQETTATPSSGLPAVETPARVSARRSAMPEAAGIDTLARAQP